MNTRMCFVNPGTVSIKGGMSPSAHVWRIKQWRGKRKRKRTARLHLQRPLEQLQRTVTPFGANIPRIRRVGDTYRLVAMEKAWCLPVFTLYVRWIQENETFIGRKKKNSTAWDSLTSCLELVKRSVDVVVIIENCSWRKPPVGPHEVWFRKG